MPDRQTTLAHAVAELTTRRQALTDAATAHEQRAQALRSQITRAVADAGDADEIAALRAELRTHTEEAQELRDAAALLREDAAPLEAERAALEATARTEAARAAEAAVEAALTALDTTLRTATRDTLLPAQAAVGEAVRAARTARSAAGERRPYETPWHRYPQLQDILRALEEYQRPQSRFADHIAAEAKARIAARTAAQVAEPVAA